MAILYGTLATGEVLPVEVNNKGQLMAEGLAGPQGEKGEKGDTGDPGPKGDKGDDSLPPYGYEGSVLTIVNGQPSWVGGTPPTPTPEPTEEPVAPGNMAVAIDRSVGEWKLVDDNGTEIESNQENVIRGWDCWNDNDSHDPQGEGWCWSNGQSPPVTNPDGRIRFAFNEDPFGYVFEITTSMMFYRNNLSIGPLSFFYHWLAVDDEKAEWNVIRQEAMNSWNGSLGFFTYNLTSAFYAKRSVSGAHFYFDFAYPQQDSFFSMRIRNYKLLTPDAYLKKQAAKAKDHLSQLIVGMSSDIDNPRQT